MSAPLRIYQVDVAGRKVLLRLNPADAQRLGGTPTAPDTSATADAHEGPAQEPAQDPAQEKARQPPNKARTPAGKGPGDAGPGNKGQPAT